MPLAKILGSQGADLTFHDPYVKDWFVSGKEIPAATHLIEAVRDADCVCCCKIMRRTTSTSSPVSVEGYLTHEGFASPPAAFNSCSVDRAVQRCA